MHPDQLLYLRRKLVNRSRERTILLPLVRLRFILELVVFMDTQIMSSWSPVLGFPLSHILLLPYLSPSEVVRILGLLQWMPGIDQDVRVLEVSLETDPSRTVWDCG